VVGYDAVGAVARYRHRGSTGRERLVLEAKGEGSRPQMRGNFFLHALGELLQRMDGPDANFGLALCLLIAGSQDSC